MTINIAFTGTGYISKIHAQAAQSLPDVTLAAVVNHRPESMAVFAATYNIPRQYTTVTDLLADGQIDALVISTPNYLHAPEAIAALHAGVAVMVEKPMALNAGQAREMAAASHQSGALLMVAHCWRFDEEVLWVKEQIDQDRLGPIIRTKGYGVHVHWGPGGWFTQKQYAGGGALADMGIHAIDTARFLMGDPRPVSVYAKLGTYYNTFDVDDTGLIIVNWDNGVTSYFESGWWQPHTDGPEASTQVYGRKGMGHVFPTGLVLAGAQPRQFEQVDPGFPKVRDPHCPQVMYDTQLAYFIDCVENGRSPVPGAAEGLVNMQIVDAAYQSSRTGSVVDISDWV